ncbi:glycosyltransferase family 52 protein [Psychrobacter sp. PP-21]|uniref:glycosyltransferase family 52 n=1 Tax=Psychrobacter sp. PP-21 TaxID=2957503 RepID=UPI0029A4159C|nr:glycosyltransferase family 52 [Psychrobacter sp. PP-21]MDX2372580.1 glycosyltransferase family 52 protein [Psychrobacter sp. PP-21]
MDSAKLSSRSLIMCVTPLQMIIAEKIIELNPDEIFDVLVIALNNNDKYKYYFDRLKKTCVASLYYIPDKGVKGFFSYTRKLEICKLNAKYQNIYLASIDSRHFQYIISKNKAANIYTFDDGTANIIPSSLYYSNSKPKFFKRAIWRILGVKYYMEDLKKISLSHYTIYKDIPNIIENKVFLSLFPRSDVSNDKGKQKQVIKFYLGQPLTEISEIFDISYVEKNINKLGIDYYYPHPREKVCPKGGFKLVESPLIFEDYIVQFLVENPDVNIEVFSFISTTLLNIMNLNNVYVSYIHDTQLFNLHQEFYNFAYNSFGINHLDLDNEFL